MATTAQVTKIRRTRATTIVTPQAPSPAAMMAKTNPTVSSKPHTNTTRVQATAAQVKDPENLARIINQIQSNSDQATVGSRTNPMNAGGVILKAQPFTAGVPKLVQHNLGRQPQGYLVLRTQNVTAAGAYGELYNVLADSQAINISGPGSFFQMPQSHAGPSSGTTLATGTGSNGKITVNVAGTYWLSLLATGSEATGAGTLTGAIFINGVQQADLLGKQFIDAGALGNLFQIAVAGIRTLNVGDVIDARFEGSVAMFFVLDTTTLSVFASMAPAAMAVEETTLPAGYDSTIASNLIASATGTVDLMVF